ncbi:MAG: restriction endonuclease subunit S, partial [Paludibacteraceae bacterium]|nr:restriction endonuclease subunit S [Paludibacteraceae bacterium]
RGKLVAQNPEDEPAGELLKRIKEEKAKTTKGKKAIADVEIDEVPFELPKGWEWCTIDCISKNVLAGGDKPDICQKQKNEKCDIPIYANAVQDDGLYGYTNIPTQPDVPAITVSARGTIGFVCVRRHPYTPIVRLISLIPIYVDVDYLAMALNSIITTSEGSSIPQLTVPSFKTMLIPLPPLSEQKRIVEKIEEVMGVLERIEGMM